MDYSSKLILGTVQFGLQYGINSAGRPSMQQVSDILSTAKSSGIDILDTSSGYGEAERILGLFNTCKSFSIVSKYPRSKQTVIDSFNKSIKALGCKKLYGYLLHHFDVYKQNKIIWKDFIELKNRNLVDCIGFSLYESNELEMILDDGVSFDLVQVPFNIFDRQFEPYFQLLKNRGVKIHVRSTFLQGLFFMDRERLPSNLLPLKKYLLALDELASKRGLSITQMALNNSIHNSLIDGVLIGVDNKEQLDVNIKSVIDSDINIDIQVPEDLHYLLKPINWN